MKPVKEYLEYRDFLHDFYAEKKHTHSFYSLRYMGGKVGVDPSHLVKIFQRQRHIGNSLIEIFIRHCELTGSDAEYFANLVRFNKAKSDGDSKMYYEKLIALKGAGAWSLEKSQYEFYTQWYHSAILTLLDFYPITDDYAALASRLTPPVTEATARKSVALLKKLGLVRRKTGGTWELTHKIITTGDHCRSIAVKAFQETTMRLAVEALHRHPPEKRNISTVTITIAEHNLDRINELIAQFRESLLQMAHDEKNPDKVYQLNIQFYPLTR
ncbi:MAG: TIGR02147 family protein [Chitinispirillaceae bacterium]|nr:TIGR02147 family protein [Chitinispirillaceae bacterium]